jgi:hypothetical protein
MIVLGIDPGAKFTGLCLIDGREVISHSTICGKGITRRGYAREVIQEAFAMLDLRAARVDLIAVEDVVKPSWYINGKASPMDPETLIGVSHILGAVESTDWDPPLALVRPGGNGSRPFGAYPEELVSDNERRAARWQLKPAGKGKLCHARSGYDVARAAATRNHLLR